MAIVHAAACSTAGNQPSNASVGMRSKVGAEQSGKEATPPVGKGWSDGPSTQPFLAPGSLAG